MAVSPLNHLVAGVPILRMGEPAVTLYLADLHFTRPGPPLSINNPVFDAVIHTAQRNLTSMLTAPLILHKHLQTVLKGLPTGCPVSVQVIGDVCNNGYKSEIDDFVAVCEKNNIQADGYNFGNHEGKNYTGVVNLLSRGYRFLRKLLGRGADLEKELVTSGGGEENVLTQIGTYEKMHRILHLRTGNAPGLEVINTPVARASEIKNDDLKHFWKPTRPGLWEALVNCQIADLPVAERKSDVHPFYVHASLQWQTQLDDGSVVPLYTVSLDSQGANESVFSANGAISEFQVRLVEAFIEERRRVNPQALFKFTSHFPPSRLLNCRSKRADRAAFKRPLSRKEVVSSISGHTHKRDVRLLPGGTLSVTLPSTADYLPYQDPVSKRDKDGLAIGIERSWIERGADGRPELKISMEFKGLNREDFKEELTPEVEAALKKYRTDHGYMHAKETFRDLRTKYLKGYLKRQVRRFWNFLSVGLNPLRRRTFLNYWKTASLSENISDNLKTISVSQMLNEAKHHVPLLDGILHFLNKEGWGELPVMGLIQGIRNNLSDEYGKCRPEFEAAFVRGEEAATLVQHADLFERIKLYRLPRILLDLPEGSEAQVFAVRAGTGAARDEYLYEGRKPTKIPNKVPPITIPIG